MDKGRFFISPNITEGMFSEINSTGEFGIFSKRTSLSNIAACDQLFTSIKNQALVGTLVNLGIDQSDRVEKFTLGEGDTLFTVQTSDIVLRDYKDELILPPNVTLGATEYHIEIVENKAREVIRTKPELAIEELEKQGYKVTRY